MRVSVPDRTLAKLDRCRNTINADAAIAAATAATGLPVAYAMGGSANDATTDPREMYFVAQTAIVNNKSVGGTAIGVRTEKTPHAVATPFPPRNLSHTGYTCPTIAANP